MGHSLCMNELQLSISNFPPPHTSVSHEAVLWQAVCWPRILRILEDLCDAAAASSTCRYLCVPLAHVRKCRIAQASSLRLAAASGAEQES
jgi:hypothetical protein